MTQRLLDGLRVLDFGNDAGARAARVLADLGADVVRVVPPTGDPLRGNIARAWNAGKQVTALGADDPALEALLADADVVIDEIGRPGTHQLDPARAPHTVWVRVSPPLGSRWRSTRSSRPTPRQNACQNLGSSAPSVTHPSAQR